MGRIDIILLTCNRIDFLKQCINAFEERLKTRYRLIVVNNNSKDGTTKYLNELKEKSEYPIVLIHRAEGEELPSAFANTEAMKHVKSEFFVTTQDDLIIPFLDPCLLKQMVRLMERHLECGALALRDQEMQRKPIGDEKIFYNIRACPAWFRMQRKSDIESVGGFGETRRWEDSEMVKICKSIGKQAGFASNLRCNNLGTAPDRGYPAWHIENMKGDKRFEWIENDKKQYEKVRLDYMTNEPVDDSPYAGAFNIQGWMRPIDLDWIYNISKTMDSIVEVGSWKGRSTYAFLAGCKGIVHAVDHFLGSEGRRHSEFKDAATHDIHQLFLDRLSHFKNLKTYKMDSLEAVKQFADNSVDLVFIDAGHTYEEVVADIKAWGPKAKKMICGHDLPLKSVRRAVQHALGEPEVNTYDGHIWVIKK